MASERLVRGGRDPLGNALHVDQLDITHEASSSPGLRLLPNPTALELEEERQRQVRRSVASALAREGLTYFITYESVCKIGYTDGWPRDRFRNIQAMSPVMLALSAVGQGGRLYEGALHHRFRRSRLHGEWFRLTKSLQALIDDTTSELGSPEAEFGIPEYLFRLSLADALDEAEDQRLRMKRREHREALYRRLSDYNRRGIPAPAELLIALNKTTSLLK